MSIPLVINGSNAINAAFNTINDNKWSSSLMEPFNVNE